IRRKPLSPLFIHAGEILNLGEGERGADDFVERAAGRAKDGFNVLEALTRLVLNRPRHLSRRGIGRTLGRDEDEAAGLHGLTVCADGLWRLVCEDDFFRHALLLCLTWLTRLFRNHQTKEPPDTCCSLDVQTP